MTNQRHTQTHKPIEPLPLQLARVADTMRLLTYRLAHTADDRRLEYNARKAATDLVAYLVEIARKSPQTRFLTAGHETTPPTAKQRDYGPFSHLSGHIYDRLHQAPTPGPAETHDTHAPTPRTRLPRTATTAPDCTQ